MSRRPHPDLLAAAVLAAVAVGGALAGVTSSAAAQPADAVDFTFPLFNDTYRQPGAVMAPVTQGDMKVHLRSPDNRLTLRTHRVRLAPLADGTHWAEFLADFTGGGTLVADLDLGGSVSRLTDEVVIPPQTRTVRGRVRVVRAGEDYEITPVEMPERVPVAVKSQLAGRFGALCESLRMLPMVEIDCSGVEAGFSTVQVPLPAVGDTYVLPAERLTADDRRQLDAYLADSAARMAQ
ncbi:MAG TPA: hypothetical protein VHQ65_15665 [Thermoanaerobaculia bacterium]|nr:hypothetical protein [Thermoanaerobaculia bacterium]